MIIQNRVKIAEPYLVLIISILVIIPFHFIKSYFSSDSKFTKELSRLLSDNKNPEIVAKQKQLFAQVYGIEGAKKQAKTYCQLVQLGEDKYNSSNVLSSIEMVLNGQSEDRDLLQLVAIDKKIETAAKKVYCPQTN